MLNNSILSNKNIRYSSKWKEQIIELFGETYQLPEDFTYRIITVSPEHVARPDLIAKIMYDNTAYGDLICRLNGISNPFELNEGVELIIPDITDVDNFLMPASDVDDIEDNPEDPRVIKPVAKKRKEKRAPNEAIIGDSRFKIDKTSRVIIY